MDITELNELIYTVAKLVCDKIGILDRNTKLRWEMRFEGRMKKLRQQAKLLLGSKNIQRHNGMKRLKIFNDRQDWQYNRRKK